MSNTQKTGSKTWFKVALDKKVVRRAGKISLIVGSLLVMINQGDLILSGELQLKDWIKIALTYCVPYCVATYSAVGAILEQPKHQ